MNLTRIKLNQLKVGYNVDYDIYGSQSELLLKRGAVITSAYQVLQLTARGYCEEQSGVEGDIFDGLLKSTMADHPSPFGIIENSAFQLGRIFFRLSQGEQSDEEILALCRDLSSACVSNPDATLGAVHLLHGHAYTTIHPIHTATMAHFLCCILGMDEDETQSILAAALTSNISMLDLQEVLQTQDEPLSDEQKDEIQNHPARSVDLLKLNGIDNELWLAIVGQHHERLNGKGYPEGIANNDIAFGAKIVAVADAYCAMISPRIYRQTSLSQEVLEKFMLGKGEEFDESLCRLLVKHIGAFTPGSFVKLANDETAIVVRRGSDNAHPIVAVIMAADGSFYPESIIRDTHAPAYSIQATVPRSWTQKLNLSSIWGYDEE